MARNAKGGANSKGVPTVCKGHELCHHYIRVVRAETDSQHAAASTNEIAKIDFVGPPLDGIAFGKDGQSGELIVRFPGTVSYAVVVWDKRSIRDWLCQHYISGWPMDQKVTFSRDFETFMQKIL